MHNFGHYCAISSGVLLMGILWSSAATLLIKMVKLLRRISRPGGKFFNG
jgi:hypothetical protein